MWLFYNQATYLYISFTTKHPIIGTLLFASVNSQQGYAQLYCDDLESLTYTIIYLALGDLLWISYSTVKNKKAVLRMKTLIMVEELCKGLPSPFCKFVNYVHSLGFDEKPDYQHLCSILLQCYWLLGRG